MKVKLAITACFFFVFLQVSLWYDLMTSRTSNMTLSKFSEEKYVGVTLFLKDFVDLIKDMHIRAEDAGLIPVQKGINLATTSSLNMQELLLNNDNFKFVMIRGFTQDELENLSSQIRFKNLVPKALEFKNALRIILLSRLIKSSNSNSSSTQRFEYASISLNNETESSSDMYEDHNLLHNCKLPEIEELALYNLSGYCANRYIKYNKNCCNFLLTKERPTLADLTDERCYEIGLLTLASISVYELCSNW